MFCVTAHFANAAHAQGFNATIFAYGQTGAGKTFTMFGPDDYVPYPQVSYGFSTGLGFGSPF